MNYWHPSMTMHCCATRVFNVCVCVCVCVCKPIAFIYWLADKNNNPEGKGDKSNHTTQGDSDHTHTHTHTHSESTQALFLLSTILHIHAYSQRWIYDNCGNFGNWLVFQESVCSVERYHSPTGSGHSSCPSPFAKRTKINKYAYEFQNCVLKCISGSGQRVSVKHNEKQHVCNAPPDSGRRI